MLSRRSFALIATSTVFNGLLSGCGGGSAEQTSPIVAGDALNFQFTDLGEQFSPVEINNRGEIIGYRATVSGEDRTRGAILRRPDGTMRDLSLPAEITTSYAETHEVALNDNGTAIVTYRIDEPKGPFLQPTRTFLFQNGEVQDIGMFPDSNDSRGVDLNNRNQIIGYFSIGIHGIYEESPFLWQDGQLTEVTLREGFFDPQKINDNGMMIGNFYVQKTLEHGTDTGYTALFENGVIQRVKPPTAAEGFFRMTALNNRGQIIGFVQDTRTGTSIGGTAYLRDNGTFTNITAIGGQAEFDDPRAINLFGSIVGGRLPRTGDSSHYSGPKGRAFLYQAGKTYDLQASLPADSGWELQQALDINDQGQIIGTGLLNGRRRAFLMTPRA